MIRIGPFLRRVPSTITAYQDWAWCYLWLNSKGETVAIDWWTSV
jgi:hypothetical protein